MGGDSGLPQLQQHLYGGMSARSVNIFLISGVPQVAGIFGTKQGAATKLAQTVRLSNGELGARQSELESLVSRLETMAGLEQLLGA